MYNKLHGMAWYFPELMDRSFVVLGKLTGSSGGFDGGYCSNTGLTAKGYQSLIYY